MLGRSTMGAIYILRRLIGRFREKKKDLLMVYLDIKKAYDRIPKEVIWHILDKKSVQKHYIKLSMR